MGRNCIRKYCGRRRNGVFFLLFMVLISVEMLASWKISIAMSRALLPPLPRDQGLDHYRKSRSLKDYLDNIHLLYEPPSICENLKSVPLIIMVASSPSNRDRRDAVRRTWGHQQPTVFVMGVSANASYRDEMSTANYIEAKQHGDILLYDFHDHYQNLTLKTVLMVQWTTARCAQAGYMFKTDDDVFVNPWAMTRVINDHTGADLIGYRLSNVWLRRDLYDKWYMPRWLFHEDFVPEYLSGSGYLISGKILKRILEGAFKVPLLNLEDVYITYSIAKAYLRSNLTHDDRLSPYRPWVPVACARWTLACSHSFRPHEVIEAWTIIQRYSVLYKDNDFSCDFYERYLSKLQLYYV